MDDYCFYYQKNLTVHIKYGKEYNLGVIGLFNYHFKANFCENIRIK